MSTLVPDPKVDKIAEVKKKRHPKVAFLAAD
jgi:hypothetical protein